MPTPTLPQEGPDTAGQAALRHSGPPIVMMAFLGISPGSARGGNQHLALPGGHYIWSG